MKEETSKSVYWAMSINFTLYFLNLKNNNKKNWKQKRIIFNINYTLQKYFYSVFLATFPVHDIPCFVHLFFLFF